MKKLLAVFAAIFAINSPVFAQTAQEKQRDNVYNKPVLCYPAVDLLAAIQENFKEETAFVVSHEYSAETLVAMFVNTETGTYTIIEFNSEMACVLASGAGFKLLPLKYPGIML
jgi:hypothetical protein